MDMQFEALAEMLVTYSVRVQQGELVYVDTMDGTPIELVQAIMKQVEKAGGYPYAVRRNERLVRQMAMCGHPGLLKLMKKIDMAMVNGTGKGILFRDFSNIFATIDVPSDKMRRLTKLYAGPMIRLRSKLQNWVLSRFPTPAMAQLMNMSYEQLYELYFQASLMDYTMMAKAAEPLVELMEQTDEVRIVGPGDTDLRFSIKDIGVIPCVGRINIPDGEVFTAPVRNSVNGILCYNTKTISREGKPFEGLRFEFQGGKIVKATCEIGNQASLDAILDTDPGARYIGEFALGFNPFIENTFGEVLFDEKVWGSFHFTPGKPYPNADNGNRSNIHWDIVCIQRPEFGGGEILFDDVPIRRDGLFIHDRLIGLNPEALKNIS